MGHTKNIEWIWSKDPKRRHLLTKEEVSLVY